MSFKKGQSGNPSGRPKGVKDKRTELRELLEPHAEALVKKAVDLALMGDTSALRLCLERIIPAVKSIEVNPGGNTIDILGAMAAAQARVGMFLDNDVDPLS